MRKQTVAHPKFSGTKPRFICSAHAGDMNGLDVQVLFLLLSYDPAVHSVCQDLGAANRGYEAVRVHPRPF